jgi:hypothetical protein
MVRGLRMFAVLAFGSAVLMACPPKKSGGADGGGDAAPVTSASADAASAALAANEADISRYPDETPVNHSPMTTVWLIADVRTQAGSGAGNVIADLVKGTNVDKIAERQGYYLVIFTDPSDATRKEMGWVSQAIFSPEPAYKRVVLKCPSGVPILLQGGLELCVAECTSNSQCKAGWSCTGDGVLSNNGVPGNKIQYCLPASNVLTDGGITPPTPPAAVDAGPPPASDAGGGGGGPAVVCVKQNPPGKCAAPFVVSSAVCRIPCTTVAQCGGPAPKCNGGLCFNSNGCQ